MEKFLEILGLLGTDNPPSMAELSAVKDGIARELHRLKREGSTDLAALTKVREAYTVADRAVKEFEAAEAATRAELEAALSDVPDPDAPAAVEDEDSVDEEAPAPVNASALSLADAVRRLGLVSVNEPAPAAPVADPVDTLANTSTVMTFGGREVNSVSLGDLSTAVLKAAKNSKAGRDTLLSATTTFAAERTLTGKTALDTSVVENFMSPEAVTAAGGCCSLPEPIRENPVAGSTARPIRDSLNTLGARAGQFTFYPAICDVDGVGLWTCAQDAAVDPANEATWKVCSHSECDDPETVGVEAIYTCRTVGNYKAMFAPEQWAGELRKLAIQQARVAERELFNKMRLGVTTTHPLTATGSVYLTLLQGVSLAAAAIRQDQRLGDVQLNLWMPEWLQNAIFSDLTSRRFQNVDSLAESRQAITTALGALNVRPHWSQDIDPIEEDSPGQVDGPLTAFPATAHTVLAPDGYFTFLDGGQLDLGTEIRDHDLNRQNSLAVFSESFEGLLARGCNAKALDVPVQVCATAPCPVA